jgi:hypothetical protein
MMVTPAAGLSTSDCAVLHVLAAAVALTFASHAYQHIWLRSRTLQVAAAGRELALLQQQLAAAESEAAGLHTALQEAQERHAHQLFK